MRKFYALEPVYALFDQTGVIRIEETMSEIDKLLSSFPRGVGELTKQVCELVLKHAVGAEQRVQHGWKVVIYEYEKGFCAVAPHKNWVNLQFYAGTDLPDPSNLLEGTGKSMRHVKVRSSDDLGRGVISLVKAAAKQAKSKNN